MLPKVSGGIRGKSEAQRIQTTPVQGRAVQRAVHGYGHAQGQEPCSVRQVSQARHPLHATSQNGATEMSSASRTRQLDPEFLKAVADSRYSNEWVGIAFRNRLNTGTLYADAPVSESAPDTDAVLLPRELTAENGAKAALMGEFRADHDGGDYVSWDTIKRIHRRVVELFAKAQRSMGAPSWKRVNVASERGEHALPGTQWSFWFEMDGWIYEHTHVLPPFVPPSERPRGFGKQMPGDPDDLSTPSSHEPR